MHGHSHLKRKAISSRSLLQKACNQLEEAGSESPYLDAMLILGHVWETTRERLYTMLGDPVSAADAASFDALIQRRLSGEPVAYILGYKEFFGHRFRVNHDVLVPRPDTEVLVETALELCPAEQPAHVHDCCTGTGCVAVSIAAERPRASVSMSDISVRALAVAEQNVEEILGEPIPSWRSDLLCDVPGRFDLITCNPPYLPDADMQYLRSGGSDRAHPQLSPSHEPPEALYGGKHGLEFIERLIRDALASLTPNGYIVIEIADAQAVRVTNLLETAGYQSVFVQRDLAGRRRVVGGQACPDTSTVQTGTHGRLH